MIYWLWFIVGLAMGAAILGAVLAFLFWDGYFDDKIGLKDDDK